MMELDPTMDDIRERQAEMRRLLSENTTWRIEICLRAFTDNVRMKLQDKDFDYGRITRIDYDFDRFVVDVVLDDKFLVGTIHLDGRDKPCVYTGCKCNDEYWKLYNREERAKELAVKARERERYSEVL